MGRSINRRSFLSLAGATVALPSLCPRTEGITRRFLKSTDFPFQLGVASGDPSPDGFVLWTRLAPKPLEGGGMPNDKVSVDWQIANDEKMTQIVKKGQSVASPDLGHSVHVEVNGLTPGQWYWYQFRVGNDVSRIGRTRTAPAIDTSPNVQFAFASCQHYESGYFTAYEDMNRQELDLIIHLGDYIYEGAAAAGKPRKHVGGELMALDDYRNRYAQYRTDPNLQTAHARFPWLVTWDDHEFDNNCAGAVSEELHVATGDYLRRRARAYQAYYEMMPLRRTAMPQGPHLRLYRRVPFGRLVDFDVLDTRQYRTDQPCGDGNKPPCKEVYDPNASLLGAGQEMWLMEQLKATSATWNCLAQQVMMARVDRKPGPDIAWSMDQWAGYDVARKRLVKFLADAHISNPVVLTGDIHTNWVNDIKVDFDKGESPTVATEFVGTSISSGGDGAETRSDTAGVLSDNPFVKFYNAERGYVRCSISEELWKSDYRVIDVVSRPGGSAKTRASFAIENGRPGAKRDV